MAEEPAPKRARLQGLRSKLPFVSQTALAALLRIAETEELPTGAVSGRPEMLPLTS